MSKRFQLTPEQIALSEERKAKKQKLQSQPSPSGNGDGIDGCILTRPWISLKHAENLDGVRLKLLTWNMLAQCLVRRELFPTSNCLKGVQRQPMLHTEILRQNADILCLQEVDSLDKLLPALTAAGYTNHYAAGPGKKHGCLVAFKKPYSKIEDRLIHYDEQHVRTEGNENARRGSSFRTRNIGSLVALKNIDAEGEGVIIGTTHLFWHPKQAGILIREIAQFRFDLHMENWPCLIAGDFNFSPDDAGYSLLVGDQLNSEQQNRLRMSRVVHVSVDPAIPPTTTAALADDENDAVDPDRVITNARPAVPTDGLLSDSELATLFSSANIVRSAYDEGIRQHREKSPDLPTFGTRVSLPSSAKGSNEPEYTSYTHYWKADYIFILSKRPAVVGGLLAPHTAKDLVPGLPQKGVSGSDHISLCAEILLPKSN
ncbi:Endonuclease/exonuclease/phosphatase [Mycena belliarum]|uniref:Endonuclease/exonuclease/phosphatase n=1 Tax=Mycena belliarum TaxID=1033014 RepID=A0AAD6UHR0_9AGAR|nr:Endonuclease/exonuclease/phosphatase [Mycena belliae]